MRDDFTRPFDLVFNRGLNQGIIDRPIRIVYREGRVDRFGEE